MFMDSVQLVTGVEVPDPLIWPTIVKVHTLYNEDPRFLEVLVAIAMAQEDPDIAIENANGLMVARLRDEDMELINSDNTMNPGILEIIKALIVLERIGENNYRIGIRNPVPFPARELRSYRKAQDYVDGPWG
jgi:hypothetical protein